MKTIKSLLCILLGAFLYTGCSTNDQPDNSTEINTVTFQFDAKKVFDTKALSAIEGYQQCLGNTDVSTLYVDIALTGPETKVLTNVPVKLFGDNLKTDPIELKSGEYTVTNVIVYSGTTPLYAGVVAANPLPLFAPFIPAEELMGNKKFTLQNYTKPTITLFVLCAQKEPATNFGMPKFELNRIEVTCFDIFVNVCDKYGEHVVGEGTVYLMPHNAASNGAMPDFSKALYQDTFNGGTIANGQPATAGDIATLCFPDNMEIADNNEVYDLVFHITNALEQQIFTQTVTVENLLKFKESDLWDESMNAIHVEYCGGIPFCIIPNDDCGGNTDDCDPFMPGTSNQEDFQIYADNAALQAAWPWEIKNVNLISMIGIQGTSDKYVYVKGNQQGEITWKSQQFKFTNGDKILIDAAIRKLNSDDTPANPGGASFDAWLKVNLIDENGKKVGTEWKQKMQSNTDFALQTFEVIRKNTGTGCYRLAITLDMQSGKQERFEFKMDNIKIVK
ncbi:MAG: hypothetical protein ACRDD8_04240 [Bacteroidales bacterium]